MHCKSFRLILAACLAATCLVVRADAGPTAEQDRANDAAAIRLHRLHHLDEKLSVPAEELQQHCRYESDIGTRPPLKRIALTFDDGPEPEQSQLILATLRKYGIPAAFFLIGEKARLHPELVQAVQESGVHSIGNHSWSHPNFHSIDVDAQRQQVLEGEAAIAKVLTQKLFRYPYGNSSCETNAFLKERGYHLVGWHIDSCDWAFDHHGSVDVREATECGVLPQNRNNYVEHVLSTVRAHQGGIVLMHEIHPNTLRELDGIIQALLAEGYTFTSLTDPAFDSSLR